MHCLEVSELFSPFLDGELNEIEQGDLQKHLAHCSECRSDFDEWQKIACSLQSLRVVEAIAPPGFSTAVMSQIRAEQNKSWQSKFAHWRAVAIATAAAFIITMGSFLLPPIIRIADNNTVIDNPSIIDNNANPGISESNNLEPNASEPLVIDQQPITNVAEKPSAKTGTDTVPAETVEPKNDNNAPVAYTPMFTNSKPPLICNTLMTMKVTEPGESVESQLFNIASNNQAKVQLLSKTQNGLTYNSSYKIVVDINKVSALIAQLSSLGTVVSSQADNLDISSDYATKSANYLALQNQRKEAAGLDSANLKALDEQIAKLEEQLKNWDAECKQQTIVLLLLN